MDHEHVFEIMCLGDGKVPCINKEHGCAETQKCKGCLFCKLQAAVSAKMRLKEKL